MTPTEGARRLRVGSEVIEYFDHGEGQAVLLVHGGAFSDWFAPAAATAELAGFRVLRPRRAGYVSRAAPGRHLTLADHARHCASLLEALGIEAAHVCGHSSGALIGLQLAMDRPELLRSLVLLEPAPGGDLASDANREVLGRCIGPALGAIAAGALERGFEMFMTAVGGEHYRAVIETALGPDSYHDALRQSSFLPDEGQAVLEWHFGAAEAARIKTPMLVVEGGQTPNASVMLPHSVAKLAELVPHAETTLLAAASHLMPLEDPGGVAGLIAAFAQRHRTIKGEQP
jgi:pimeloyl-ACP methyl ester carboxylesterase